MEKQHDNSNISAPLMATMTTQDHEINVDPCEEQKRPDPCTIVIVGASGDLTARKIVPSLFSLFIKGELPEPCVILGCGRTNLNDHEFRGRMKEVCLSLNEVNGSDWERFSEFLYYRSIEYKDVKSYENLAGSIRELE